jgi:hypothetical protein
MSIWVSLKLGVEENHDVFEFLTKNQPDPVHILGEKTKSSPTRTFASHVIIGTTNSNSLTNSSYRKAFSFQGRFKWSPRI